MISVCIATYNGAKYINEQIKSILSQLSLEDEIIISDDSSTDNTLEIIKKIKDNRIKIFPNQTFRNPIFNFENALKLAKGDYIFLADQDDVWLKNKVSIVKEELVFHDVVITNCKIVDKNLKPINVSFFDLYKSKNGFISNLLKNSYLGCCMAFRKEILPMVLPFPKNIPMHDIWIGIVAELFYKSKFIQQPLVLYRRHGENESPAGEYSPFNFYNKVIFRINIIRNIPKLFLKAYLKK